MFMAFSKSGDPEVGGVLEVIPEKLRLDQSVHNLKLGLMGIAGDGWLPGVSLVGLEPKHVYVVPMASVFAKGRVRVSPEGSNVRVIIVSPTSNDKD